MRGSFPNSTHLWFAVASAAVLCAPAGAATADYFLKLGTIKGETADKEHKGEIQVESWSWGATQTSSSGVGGGMGAGKVNVQDIHVTTAADGTAAPADLKMQPGGGAAQSATGARVAVGDVTSDGRPDVAVASPRDAASGLPTGKRQHKPLTIRKSVDKATPVLAEARPLAAQGSLTVEGSFPGCKVGTAYEDAVFRAGGYTYELKDVVITSCAVSSGGGGGSAMPLEQVSFNYSQIRESPTRQGSR